MTNFDQLSHIEFLPELGAMDPAEKACALQKFLRRHFIDPNGLFYSILLIDGSHSVRPMTPEEIAGNTIIAATLFDDDETEEAVKTTGYTYENSLTSAGGYLEAQAARYEATGDPQALEEAARAFYSIDFVYEDGVRRNRAGWLGKPYGGRPKDHSTPDQYHFALSGLYRYHQLVDCPCRERIAGMFVAIADFLMARNYQIWDLKMPTDAYPWNPPYDYANTTYIMALALAYHVTGTPAYRDEALRMRDMSDWITKTKLDRWADQNLKTSIEYEQHGHHRFMTVGGEIIHEVLPEVFGATPEQADAAFASMVTTWWKCGQLGMDAEWYSFYWIEVDVPSRAWKPTGYRENVAGIANAGTFGSYYSAVRMGDIAYRQLYSSFIQMLYGNEREAGARWTGELLHRATGERLKWLIDRDGKQLKPDIQWMGCCCSSEAPFAYLTVYWRGRARGYWK